jgi:hypothetical protein
LRIGESEPSEFGEEHVKRNNFDICNFFSIGRPRELLRAARGEVLLKHLKLRALPALKNPQGAEKLGSTPLVGIKKIGAKKAVRS